MEHVEANLRDNDAAAVTLEQRTLRALKDADRTARLLKHLFERDGAVDIVAAFSKGLIRPDAYLVVSICDAGGHVILSSEARAVGRHAAPGDVGAQRHRRGHRARARAPLHAAEAGRGDARGHRSQDRRAAHPHVRGERAAPAAERRGAPPAQRARDVQPGPNGRRLLHGRSSLIMHSRLPPVPPAPCPLPIPRCPSSTSTG